MRKHILIVAASVAALGTTAPVTVQAQGLGLGSVFSCDGKRGTTGAIVGGLAGALAGRAVAKNNTIGTIAGAGIGAFAGNQIACKMSTSGRRDAQTAFQRTLDTGRASTWRDPRTGTSGRIELIDNGYAAAAPYAGDYARPVSATDLRFARGVERVYRLSSSEGGYLVERRINMRAAPDTRAPVVDRLTPGERIEAAGLTSDGWLAVEQDDRVVGYVMASLVRPEGGLGYASNRGCRLVQQTISATGRPTEVIRYNACRDRSGEWRLNPA